MRRTRLTAAVAAVLITFGVAIAGSSPPEPPKGFSWKKIEGLKSAFLLPDGWHFKQDKKKNTLAIFITQENIDKAGKYETGLSVNIIRSLKDVSAVQYAERFIAKLGDDHEQIRTWKVEAGVLKGNGCLVKTKPKDGGPVLLIHALAIGNAKTNTLHLILFESPESKWKEAWLKGETIMKKLGLDNEI